MNEIKMSVTVDEANLILEGLGQLPFARVYALVAKLQDQARGQLEAQKAQGKAPDGAPAEAQEAVARG